VIQHRRVAKASIPLRLSIAQVPVTRGEVGNQTRSLNLHEKRRKKENQV